MHRLIQDHLEEVLAESNPNEIRPPPPLGRMRGMPRRNLRAAPTCRHAPCAACARIVNDDTLAPRPGFYARVMERIEAQRPIDIWQLFFDSAFGRRIAIASVALALVFSLYLVSSERFAQPVMVSVEDHPGMTLTKAGLPDKDTVLVDLVTYREQ